MEGIYKYIIDTNLVMFQKTEQFNEFNKKDLSFFTKIARTINQAHDSYTLPWLLAWVVLRHDGLILHTHDGLEISRTLDSLLETSDINLDRVKYISWNPIRLESLLREIDNVMEFKPWL